MQLDMWPFCPSHLETGSPDYSSAMYSNRRSASCSCAVMQRNVIIFEWQSGSWKRSWNMSAAKLLRFCYIPAMLPSQRYVPFLVLGALLLLVVVQQAEYPGFCIPLPQKANADVQLRTCRQTRSPEVYNVPFHLPMHMQCQPQHKDAYMLGICKV